MSSNKHINDDYDDRNGELRRHLKVLRDKGLHDIADFMDSQENIIQQMNDALERLRKQSEREMPIHLRKKTGLL